MDNQEKMLYVERVKSKYVKSERGNIDRIKELDKKATTPAVVIAYTVGVIGALIFGAGLCFAMKVIGDSVVLGIVLGIIGMAVIGVNYPLYVKNLEKGKDKYRQEILDLITENKA